MSNPFDQFASAMPTAPAPAAPEPASPAPAAPQQPVMNAPPQQMYGQQPQMYGQAPPAAGYGQQQPPPPSPQQQPFAAPYGQQPPFAAPPAQVAPTPYGAPPAEQSPFGVAPEQPAAQPPAQPPAQLAQPDGGNPFGGGAPPAAPEMTQPDAGNPFGGGAPPPAQPEASQQPPADPWGAAPPAADPAQQPPAQNPYAPPAQPYGATTPYGVPPQDPAAAQNPYAAAPTQDPSQPPAQNPYGAPPAQDPAAAAQNPYGAPPGQDPLQQQPPQNPYGAPPAQDPSLQQPPQNPYGAPPVQDPSQQQPPQDPAAGALVPAQQQSNPYAQNPYAQAPPYGQPNPYGQPPAAYGQPPPQQPPAAVDPFSVFEAQKPPAPAAPAPESQAMVPVAPAAGAPPAAPAQPNPTASDDDFWGAFSANGPAPAADDSKAAPDSTVREEKKGDEGLPPGGEWYDAKIFTPTLGVMFFKPQELTDSLFLNTDKSVVDSLGERPVVAFIVEGSSARSAGVELGHVLLKVNGVDVKNPKDASRLIKEGPRPLPLLFYVPNTDVVVAEGEHMVKYDTRDTTAPNSAKEWKPKYVVIGGIIAQPWMMNMYRSKSEYDIAVIETQARRPVSVKVKQFSLQGARIQNDWQGPQMVKYKNKLQPWKYIVVLPVARNPIKISSPNLSNLKPVHEGIRRVLLAQQRGRGSGRPSGAQRAESGGSYGRSQQPSQQQPYRY